MYMVKEVSELSKVTIKTLHHYHKIGHLEFMNKHDHNISAKDFAAQTQFFLSDDFHLRMLESQQTGLAYYLSAAAESFAATNQ